MSKELTEKFRNCTLPNGVYYLKYNNCLPFIYNSYQMIDLKKCKDSDKVEVLSAVPSYEQFIGLIDDSKELDKAYDKINLLENRLEIATKALKDYANCKPTEWMSCVTADKALKEMEGVK